MKNQAPEYDLRFLGSMLVSLLILLDVAPQLTPLLMFLPLVIIPLRQLRHRKQMRHQQKLQLQQQQKIEQYIAANDAGHRFDPATGQLILQGVPAPAKPQNRYEELLHSLRQDGLIPPTAPAETACAP